MKNLFIALFLLTNLYANAKIEKILKNRGYNAKIIYSKDSGIQNMQFVIAEQGRFWIPFLTDSKTLIGITPDTIISEDEKFSKALDEVINKVRQNNQKAVDDSIIEVFKKNANSVIKLNGENPKKTTYIVLDMNCPYCKDEIKNLDSHLKQGNVELMIVGVLGVDSAKKAATFYTNIKSKKTKNDKIAYIKSAFQSNFKPDSSVNIDEINKISMQLSGAGLQGVPYIIKR